MRSFLSATLFGACSRSTIAPLRSVRCWFGYSLIATSRAAWATVTEALAAITHRTCCAWRSHSSIWNALTGNIPCKFGLLSSRNSSSILKYSSDDVPHMRLHSARNSSIRPSVCSWPSSSRGLAIMRTK